jgi:hypothetical protein
MGEGFVNGGAQEGFVSRLRDRYQAMERDIIEEFPDYPKFKRAVRRGVIIVVMVIIVGVAALQLREWMTRRQQARRLAERAKVIQLISPVEDVREEEVEFVWRPSPIVKQYVLEISDNAYKLMWRSEPAESIEMILPDKVREQFIPGHLYHWQVRGFNDDNAEVARSAIEEIVIIR